VPIVPVGGQVPDMMVQEVTDLGQMVPENAGDARGGIRIGLKDR